jgi:hypothetical protein
MFQRDKGWKAFGVMAFQKAFQQAWKLHRRNRPTLCHRPFARFPEAERLDAHIVADHPHAGLKSAIAGKHVLIACVGWERLAAL